MDALHSVKRHKHSNVSGPEYLTALTLVQHAGYSLSDLVYSFGEGEALIDGDLRRWHQEKEPNALSGQVPEFRQLEARSGAGSLIMGTLFNGVAGTDKSTIASVYATAPTLTLMQPVLKELRAAYGKHTETKQRALTLHVSSLQLADSGFESNYASTIRFARDTGFALIASKTVFEVQHMTLFAHLLSTLVPTVHTFDGLNMASQVKRVVDVMDANAISKVARKIKGSGYLKSKGSHDADVAARILAELNSDLGTSYDLYSYSGPTNPTKLVVVFGSVEAVISEQLGDKYGVGVISIRVLFPLSEKRLAAAIPDSVKELFVLGQIGPVDEVSPLYSQLVGALAFAGRLANLKVTDLTYPASRQWTPTSMIEFLSKNSVLTDAAKELPASIDPSKTKIDSFVFWDADSNVTTNASDVVAAKYSLDSTNSVAVQSLHDHYSQGGISRTQLLVSRREFTSPFAVSEVDNVVVGDLKVLSAYDVVSSLKKNGVIILYGDIKDSEKQLPLSFRLAIAAKHAKVYTVDANRIASVGKKDHANSIALQLAVLTLTGSSANGLDAAIAKLNCPAGEGREILPEVNRILENISTAIEVMEVPQEWLKLPEGEHSLTVLPTTFNANSFVPCDIAYEVEQEDAQELEPASAAWPTAAKKLMFSEAYGTENLPRPDLPERTFVSRVQANRRLTPKEYSRNIFHIEFDISGTGMTYQIGEALGVHGHNNHKAVRDFMTEYSLDENELVEVPSRTDPKRFETRTLLQALQQNVDIFGKPPKRFYEALAPYARDEKQEKELRTLAGPTGAVDFKRRSEVDTLTYADLFLEFDSCNLTGAQICTLVPPIKRREYSIASSQKVHPNSVHLLVVVVDWKDPRGRDRFGQCSHFLSNLEIGAEVTVSVKASVMKLPPRTTQPIIMAGLGTGLAPFRALVEERALQRSQGHEIGPVMLYLGSRHKREEYLYGEEWEAYRDAGVITLLGQAFSRDQPEKVYIQDVMRNTLGEIAPAFVRDEGSFYLCGPTWPVPEVTAVLEEAIAQEAALAGTKVDTRRRIEELKEAGRYVLEVY